MSSNALATRDERGRFLQGHGLGRSPQLTEELIERIALAMVKHGSLERACALEPDIPEERTIQRWDSDEEMPLMDDGLRARFRRELKIARELRGWRLFQRWEEKAEECLQEPSKELAAAVREYGAMAARTAAVLAPHVFGTRSRGESSGSTDVSVAVQVVLPPKGDGT